MCLLMCDSKRVTLTLLVEEGSETVRCFNPNVLGCSYKNKYRAEMKLEFKKW